MAARRASRKRRVTRKRTSKRRTSRRRVTRRRRASKKRRVTKRKRTTKKRRVARRKKRVSVRGSKRQVWKGTKEKTKASGFTKKDLMENKRGKIVSKKAHKAGLRKYKANGLSKWTTACMKARKALGIVGFKAVKKGTAYYKEARKIYDSMK